MFVCPKCKSNLLKNLKSYECTRCSSSYAIVEGIPDFRVFREETYSSPAGEARKLAEISSNYSNNSLQRLLEIFYDADKYKNINPTASKLIEGYIRDVMASSDADDGVNNFFNVYGMSNNGLKNKKVLDIGCGFCRNTMSLSKWCNGIIATDISLPELVIAKKLLLERGINNIALVCACSEALPFAEAQFDMACASSVIEHVQDQNRFLAETRRVLKMGGSFIFNSPNRYFIGKEPHVGVPMVGYFPRLLMPLFVRLISRGKLTYGGIKLLSYRELKMLIRRFYGKNWECRTRLYVDPKSSSRSLLGKVYRKNIFFRFLIGLFDKYLYRPLCKAHIMRVYK